MGERTDLKEMRLEKGLSKAYVAREAGLSLNGYTQIEDGTTKDPRPENLEKIMKVLGE